MKLLRLPLATALLLPLFAGCGSSSTTAPTNTPQSSGARTEKSPDDEANEIMAKAMTLTEKERKAQGQAMYARIMELREKVSAETRKKIDDLTRITITETATAESVRPTRVDAGPAPNVNEKLTNEDPGLESNIEAAVPEQPRKGPEALPAPRELK